MRISETKQTALYMAIHEQIMGLRVEIKVAASAGRNISAEGLDALLYGLTEAIWCRQKDILKIGS